MKISIIIPVYNAGKYIEEAVKSALVQPETMEILLIEDGSPDNSLEVCKQLADRYDKVNLIRHQAHRNHGASASRNLGLINAKYEYIAFLDADDYYLKNRFTKTSEIFKNNPEIDGVYGATGSVFANNKVKDDWFKTRSHHITSISRKISPGNLFKELLFFKYGSFHTNAITVKKSLFTKTGMFNETLRLHQDIDMWFKMALLGKLVGDDSSELISIRRVHTDNRITKLAPNNFTTRNTIYDQFYKWALQNKVSKHNISLIEYRIWQNKLFLHGTLYKTKRMAKHKNKALRLTNMYLLTLKRFIDEPNLLFSKYFLWKAYDFFLTYTSGNHSAFSGPKK